MFTAASKFAVLPALALIAGLQQQPSAPAAPAATPIAPAATATAPKIDNQESFTVVGLTVRTNNAAEAGGQGQIPGLWQNAMSNGELEQIPNRVGEGTSLSTATTAAATPATTTTRWGFACHQRRMSPRVW